MFVMNKLIGIGCSILGEKSDKVPFYNASMEEFGE